MITPCPRSCGLGDSSRITAALAVWARISNVLPGHCLYARFPDPPLQDICFYINWAVWSNPFRVTVATLQLCVTSVKCTVTNSLANLGQQAILRNLKSSTRKPL